MKFRNTLILIAILAILAGYVYFFEIKREAPAQQEPAQVILDLNPDDIISLAVAWGDGDPVLRLARGEGEAWRVEMPAEDAADHIRVSNSVASLARLEAMRLLEERPADLSVYGLHAPAWKFLIGTREGGEETLWVGDQNPTRTGYFCQKQGDPAVYLVASSVIRDISGWASNPPYLPTPTPLPTDTPASSS